MFDNFFVIEGGTQFIATIGGGLLGVAIVLAIQLWLQDREENDDDD